MYSFKIVIATFVCAGLFSGQGATARAVDITDDYERGASASLNQQGLLDLVRWLSEFKVIMVPGFMADQAHKIGLNPAFFAYEEMFASARIDHEVANVVGGGRVEENARIIRRTILSSNKRVLLMGHSMGGVEILHAVAGDQRVLDKVRGIILLQAPVLGAPVADFVETIDHANLLKNPLLDHLGIGRTISAGINNILFCTLNTSLDAFLDGTTERRLDFQDEYQSSLREMGSSIPILSVVSSIQPGRKTSLDRIRQLVSRIGDRQNDGLVWTRNSIFPYGEYIWLSDIDHFDLVFGKDLQVDWQQMNGLRFLQQLHIQEEALRRRLIKGNPNRSSLTCEHVLSSKSG